MSADITESAKLFRLLQTNYFSREKWASMRQSFELLASTLHQYACEIQDKNSYENYSLVWYTLEIH